MRVHHGVHVEVRKLIAQVSFLLLPCVFCGSNSGDQCWHQMPFPISPSHQPKMSLNLTFLSAALASLGFAL